MAPGLETEHREMTAELAEVVDIVAILSGLPIIAAVRKPGLMSGALCVLPSGSDLQGACALFDQAIPDAATEAAAIAQNMDGFDDAGFSRPVFSLFHDRV